MPNEIKTYGDRKDDGAVQLSFTLPIAASETAKQAAINYSTQMGLTKVNVATMEPIDAQHTFFLIYGENPHTIDLDRVEVIQQENPLLNFDQVNQVIADRIGRKIVVLGACLGSDAHTVGIDAIFNMKGYNHDWGFERYPWMEAHNLRAQVDSKLLAEKVVAMQADAVLVSRVVTQRDEHVTELKYFLDCLKQQGGLPGHLLKICGGPRIRHQDAISWGYDAGFGPGTKPSHVASFLVQELVKRGVKK